MSIATTELGDASIRLGKTVPVEEFFRDPRSISTHLDSYLRKSYAQGGIEGVSEFLTKRTENIHDFVSRIVLPEIQRYGRYYYPPVIRLHIDSLKGVQVTEEIKEGVAKADTMIQLDFLKTEYSVEEIERFRSEQLNPKQLYEESVNGILSGIRQHATENPGQQFGAFFFESRQMRTDIETLSFLAYQQSLDGHLKAKLWAAADLTAGASGGRYRQALQMFYKGLLLSPNRDPKVREQGIEIFKGAIEVIRSNVRFSGPKSETGTFIFNPQLTTTIGSGAYV